MVDPTSSSNATTKDLLGTRTGMLPVHWKMPPSNLKLTKASITKRERSDSLEST
ncbi:hypothetical protein PGTUg99_011946 [Puccinia graminis f. sp. tritici]|uniref:Uncharacterized protein n=1 Tax=Puccinia graminis f. sp. tritici TaxID=56615 RepID=A0A5B0RJN2_PUCGR|nr:hypothetical protein PGTUg99_011946 [Puccinia graminis f. sp. tritici]